MKQKIIAVLRRLYLLQLADHIKYAFDLQKTRQVRRNFEKANPDFPMPPTNLAFDAYGHTNWEGYFGSGYEHAKYFSKLIKEQVCKQDIKICEWGCGPARVLRQLPQFFVGNQVELYGFDYNSKTINWCRDNIKGITFLQNSLSPPLECSTDYFDFLYCISVFTHLSLEMHFQWIAELSRVVKPGGIIVITSHGDSSRKKLLESEIQKFDQGEFVVRGNITEGKRCYVAYHPTQFMRQELLKDMEIISHIPSSTHSNLIHQDIWVVRNLKSVSQIG